MDRYFIPRSIAGFDTYIQKTNAYLILGTPTHAVRFNRAAVNPVDALLLYLKQLYC